MMWGADPLGALCWGEVSNPGQASALVQAWVAATGRVFLYEPTVFQRNLVSSWIETFGSLPFGTVPDETVTPALQTLRYSDVGYISKPSDSVPNTLFEGAVSSGLRMTRTTPVSPDAARRVNVEVGDFSITNVDGALDYAVQTYAVDGRAVTVKLGLDSYGYDSFVPIFTGRIVDWSNDGTNVRITMRDQGYRLDIPLQTDLYTGAGGYNGGADLTGKPRPMTFGKVLNITPPLINASLLIYQIHHRAVQAIDNVYDRGATITAGANYADYAALAAAAVSGGTYATCTALGLVRLGSAPSGLVTVDARGDATGSYVDTTGTITKRIMQDFGGLASTDFNTSLWDSFTSGLPGTIGWFQGTESTLISSALDAIFAHCAGWWGANPTGLFEAGRLVAPSSDSYYLELAEADIIDLQPLPPLSGTSPPRFRQRVGYQRNWTPQQDTDLAGTVTAARRAFLAEEYRLVSSTDTSVQQQFLLATDPAPLGSLFDSSSDAQSLSDSLLALYKAKRQPVRVLVDLKGMSAKMSANVLVTHRRLNSGNQLPMLLLDATILADGRLMELVLWG